MKKEIALTALLAGTFYIGKKLLENKESSKDAEQKEILIKEFNQINSDIFQVLDIFEEISSHSLSDEDKNILSDCGIELRRLITSKNEDKETKIKEKIAIIKSVLKGERNV